MLVTELNPNGALVRKWGVLDLQSGPYIAGESATWLWACLLKIVRLILLPGSHSCHKGTFFPDEKQMVSVERGMFYSVTLLDDTQTREGRKCSIRTPSSRCQNQKEEERNLSAGCWEILVISQTKKLILSLADPDSSDVWPTSCNSVPGTVSLHPMPSLYSLSHFMRKAWKFESLCSVYFNSEPILLVNDQGSQKF